MIPIVIVDDVREDVILASYVLRQAKLLNTLHLVNGGAECVALFTENRIGRSLVFLDLIMYPQSGLDVLRALDGNETFRSSVVVMLTGLGDVRLIQQGYQLGATSFLIKPFQLSDLMQFFFSFSRQIHLEKRRQGNALVWANDKERPSRAAESARKNRPVSGATDAASL